MKNLFKTLMIVAVIAIIGFSMASCVSATTIGGASGGHGFFAGGAAQAAVTEGYTEIASYSVILGAFDSGFADYAKKVRDAEAAGKKVISVTTWYFGFMDKVTAYAK